MKVLCITATCGRHMLVERVIWQFQQQTYNDKYLLIFQNSPVYQEKDECLGDNIILVNQHLNSQEGKFSSLGEIYNEAIKHIPEDIDVITFMDDDDQYLINHIEEGVKGYQRAVNEGKKAYKPMYSWYRGSGGMFKMNNVFEPSIFVEKNHILEYGFHDNTTAQHHKWLQPLIDNNLIVAEENSPSTLVYDWSQELPCFKTSGAANNPQNFENYKRNSNDHGDRILSPKWKKELYEELHFEANRKS